MQLFQCIFVGVLGNVQANYMWKLMRSLKVEKSMFWKFISAVDVKDTNVFRITNADTDNHHYHHHHHYQLHSGWQPRGWRSWVRAWSLDRGLNWDIDFHRFFIEERTSLHGEVGFGFFPLWNIYWKIMWTTEHCKTSTNECWDNCTN